MLFVQTPVNYVVWYQITPVLHGPKVNYKPVRAVTFQREIYVFISQFAIIPCRHLQALCSPGFFSQAFSQ